MANFPPSCSIHSAKPCKPHSSLLSVLVIFTNFIVSKFSKYCFAGSEFSKYSFAGSSLNKRKPQYHVSPSGCATARCQFYSKQTLTFPLSPYSFFCPSRSVCWSPTCTKLAPFRCTPPKAMYGRLPNAKLYAFAMVFLRASTQILFHTTHSCR